MGRKSVYCLECLLHKEVKQEHQNHCARTHSLYVTLNWQILGGIDILHNYIWACSKLIVQLLVLSIHVFSKLSMIHIIQAFNKLSFKLSDFFSLHILPHTVTAIV